MKKTILFILLGSSLLLASCNNSSDAKTYNVVAPQMVQGLYRMHNANLSYLTEYTYTLDYEYNPVYVLNNEKNNNYERTTLRNSVGVYAGVFVSNQQRVDYVGNKESAGSKSTYVEADYYWFENTSDENIKQLTYRKEVTDRDQDKISEDVKLSVMMPIADVPSYFSGAINEEAYSSYFTYKIVPLTGSKSVQIDDKTIITTTYSLEASTELIPNPEYPDDVTMKLVPFKEKKTSTTFRYIDEIGWVGTNFTAEESEFVASDNQLRLSVDRVVIAKTIVDVTYSYSKTLMAYTGGLSYKEHDSNIEDFIPSLFQIDVEGHQTLIEEVVFENITGEYKSTNASYEGYAYIASDITLSKEMTYSFATAKDISLGRYNTIGGNQLIDDASGFIIKSQIEGQNAIATLDETLSYEFLILIDKSGSGSIIARFASKL